MSGGGSNGPNFVTFDFSMRWLFMPPVVAVLTILVTGLFSSGTPIPVDPAIWGLVGLMFVLLTILYGIFVKQGFLRGLLPVQLIAQGILLCPLSLRMGARMFQWVGVLLATCGAVLLVFLYYYARSYRPLPQAAPSSELHRLPLPFVITDEQGNIISVSDFLLKLVQKTRNAISGGKITELLPLDKDTTSMGGKEWKILQTPMEGGTHYFQLEENRDPPVIPPANTNDGNFTDLATSLYNRAYAVKRVEEELYRIYRYKRWMSAALLRVQFHESETSSDTKKEDEIFNAYCRFVSAHTRETDISCLVGFREILIVMPETTLDGAQDVISKLLDFTSYLQEEAKGFEGVMEINDGVVFFSASSGELNFDLVLEQLDEAVRS